MSDFDLVPKPLFSKIWKVITWRWRMQLAINAPFGLLWVADKTNPAVHQFNLICAHSDACGMDGSHDGNWLKPASRWEMHASKQSLCVEIH